MSNQVEQILSAVVFVALGIVGVAFLTALVSNQSNTPSVISAGAGGFACTLKTAITGTNQCPKSWLENVTSNITFPGFPDPTGGTPGGGNCFTSRNCT